MVLQSLFQVFKNWLKHISALTAYVRGAAPCSTLPTADENAVTESTVLFGIFKPQDFRISCLAMVLS